MIRTLFALLLLAGCANKAPEPLPEPPPPPPPEPVVMQPSAELIAAPKKLRAALSRATPREAALVAAPTADAKSIELVRYLHRNALTALTDLERDGGRHITAAKVKKAQTAVTDLQNHLNEFQDASSTSAP